MEPRGDSDLKPEMLDLSVSLFREGEVRLESLSNGRSQRRFVVDELLEEDLLELSEVLEVVVLVLRRGLTTKSDVVLGHLGSVSLDISVEVSEHGRKSSSIYPSVPIDLLELLSSIINMSESISFIHISELTGVDVLLGEESEVFSEEIKE